MSGQRHDCGHVCCDERDDPLHDHFLRPQDCPSCKGRVPSRSEKVAALRDYLDSLDERTRLPGEPPLREAVAQQARARLREAGEIGTTVPKPGHPPVGPSGVSPSPDGSR